MISKVKEMSTYSNEETATYAGIAVKSFGLVALVAVAAITTWAGSYATTTTSVVTAMMGFITALAISFRPTFAAFLSPLYAILEGMCLASISATFATAYPGIVISAVIITFGIAAGAAIVYAKGYVTVNKKFTRMVSIAIMGVLATYIIEIILSFFGIQIPMIHQGGPLGIIVSLVVVGVATFCLFLDYEQISQSVRQGLSADYEWYCAFSLLVTLIWLYIEILDLLRKIRE
jgi:uncharacterized YccA/Bax inhibitor family protein